MVWDKAVEGNHMPDVKAVTCVGVAVPLLTLDRFWINHKKESGPASRRIERFEQTSRWLTW